VVKIIQPFGKHYTCRVQGEYINVGRILAALYSAGRRRKIGFDYADCWYGIAGWYPIETEQVKEEKRY
jgi:hypothetical protein